MQIDEAGRRVLQINENSRIADLMAHPIGHDVISKVLLQMGKPQSIVTNPLVSRLKIKTIKRLAGKRLPASFWETAFELFNSEPDRPGEGSSVLAGSEVQSADATWWKEAVFYQIYPRSFKDSNGDGIGDLAGIIEQLDYLQDLGVDALWLSPIYDSPNDDNGYDIRDYHKIMTEMGTMADFDRLLDAVHSRGMRLIMDLVVNHSSDEHAWFQAALADPDGPFGQYYFFSQTPPTQPPNNWVSFFSGSAWRWFPEQERWALHLFSSKQMDLNWDHQPLRQAIIDMVRWWLEKGVDGFRLDVINYISKRPDLPDGDAFVGDLMQFYGIENYYYGPNLHRYLHELRREAFEPYSAFSVGETPGIGIEMGRLLTGRDRRELDLIFNFDHLEMPGEVRFNDYIYDLNYLKQYYFDYYSHLTDNDWISIFWDNHDNPQMLSKINSDPQWRSRLAKLLLTLQLSLKGTVFLYQGQELGMVKQAFTDISQMRDVESINKYAELLATLSPDEAFRTVLLGSRDHARVPMRWSADEKGGFSSVDAWLPWPASDPGWSVDEQAVDPNSVLAYAKQMLSLRHDQLSLRLGEIKPIAADRRNYMAFERFLTENTSGKTKATQCLFCEFNLSDQRLPRRRLPSSYRLLMSNVYDLSTKVDRLALEKGLEYLEPYEAAIYELT